MGVTMRKWRRGGECTVPGQTLVPHAVFHLICVEGGEPWTGLIGGSYAPYPHP